MKYLIPFLALLLLGCKQPPDDSAELARLKRQNDSLALVSSIRSDSLRQLRSDIDKQVKYITLLDSIRRAIAKEREAAYQSLLIYEKSPDSLTADHNRIYREVAGAARAGRK